jgi:hypothetical protein
MKTCDVSNQGFMGVPFGIVSGGEVEPRRGGEEGLCIGMLGIVEDRFGVAGFDEAARCMTMTRSVMARTTVRSWETKR